MEEAMKPLAIDLFCGKGGWTNALLDVGFRVIGFDINIHEEYRRFLQQVDVLQMDYKSVMYWSPQFAVCSSPCEQFSVHCMKHFHKNPPYPELGIKLFNHARNLLESLGVPYVMENVRCAEKFVGRAVNHCGPFYLWGNAVPAVFSKECYEVTKGMTLDQAWDRNTGKRSYSGPRRFSSNSPERAEAVAKLAMIPYPIARAVAEAGMRLVEAAA
jgi:hypothetical protein